MATSSKDAKRGKVYIPVSSSTLIPGRPIGASLYLRDDIDGTMRLFCRANASLGKTDLVNLAIRGHSKLFVRADDHRKYQDYLRSSLSSILLDESLAIGQRFASLNEVVRDVLATSFREGKIDKTVDTCRAFAHKTVDLICRADVVVADLLGMMHHDYHTFTHSANVSYYCVMLASALEIKDQSSLVEIATGAMLHDLGKLDIPDKILCQKRRLTEDEFAVIRMHPRSGYRKLCEREDLTFPQLMMVYQHHERLDGKGYPVGVTAEEIHEWARLCSVVDVFEALTSNRPYRAGLSIDEAFEIMDRDCGQAFEQEMLQCWKTVVQSN